MCVCEKERTHQTLEVIRIRVWIWKFLEEFLNNTRYSIIHTIAHVWKTERIFTKNIRDKPLNKSMATLSYSARGYDSAVCCSKMSRDAFLSETLYEADKVLEKFAAAPRECVCLQDGEQSRR